MLIQALFVLSALLILLGGAGYLAGTLKGTTTPNRVTWFLWSLAPFVAFAGEVDKGVGLVAITTIMMGVNSLLVFLASFLNRRSVWQIGRLDIACGLLSLGGLILWHVSREGNWAILLAIAADGLAAVPTAVKVHRAPATEDARAYLLWTLGSGVPLFTLRTWDFASAAFPVYLLGVNLVLFVLIRFNRRRIIPIP